MAQRARRPVTSCLTSEVAAGLAGRGRPVHPGSAGGMPMTPMNGRIVTLGLCWLVATPRPESRSLSRPLSSPSNTSRPMLGRHVGSRIGPLRPSAVAGRSDLEMLTRWQHSAGPESRAWLRRHDAAGLSARASFTQDRIERASLAGTHQTHFDSDGQGRGRRLGRRRPAPAGLPPGRVCARRT